MTYPHETDPDDAPIKKQIVVPESNRSGSIGVNPDTSNPDTEHSENEQRKFYPVDTGTNHADS